MYKMGVAIYKQCEQRLTDLNYQELQQKVSIEILMKNKEIQKKGSKCRFGLS